MSIANITGFNNRSDGNKITASIWNAEIGGIYSYINNTLVQALNTLTTKGDIFVFDGTNLQRLPVGPTNGHTLTIDSAELLGIKWAAPGGLPLTTKGDILVHNGTTLIRVPVGPDGQVIQADSGEPAGIKWAPSGNIFQSTDYTISNGALITVAHGLGAVPRNAWYGLVCQTSELGYNVGEIVFPYGFNDSPDKGLAIGCDATNIKAQLSISGNTIMIMSRLTGSMAVITNARWKLRLFAQA